MLEEKREKTALFFISKTLNFSRAQDDKIAAKKSCPLFFLQRKHERHVEQKKARECASTTNDEASKERTQ